MDGNATETPPRPGGALPEAEPSPRQSPWAPLYADAPLRAGGDMVVR